MKKVFSILFIAGIIVLSGCNYYRTCPTYAKEKNSNKDVSSVNTEKDTAVKKI
jgi:hypothetical protein